MLLKKLGTGSSWPKFILALVCMVGLGLGGVWFLSSPALNVSAVAPARLTLQSPLPTPQISLVKTIDNSAPKTGDTINYTLTYKNVSAGSQASNVRLYDFLPAGAQLVSTDPPVSLYEDGRLLFTAPSMGPATEATVNVRVRVSEGYQQLYNHALVMADGTIPAVASLLTDVTQQPSDRVRLTKLGYTYVLTNSRLVYTLRGTNVGDVTVRDVTVVDVLPTGLALGYASPQPDPAALPLLRWSLGDLAPGESKAVVITTTSPASIGVITNSAVAGAWQNVITQSLFTTQVISEGAILRVTKEGSAPTVQVGNTLVYTIRYENAGNQSANGVLLTDTLPADITVTDVYPPTMSQTPQQLVWNLDVLSTTVQGQVVITTTVGGRRGRVLHNVVDIAGQPGSYPDHAELDTPVPLVKLYLPVVRK